MRTIRKGLTSNKFRLVDGCRAELEHYPTKWKQQKLIKLTNALRNQYLYDTLIICREPHADGSRIKLKILGPKNALDRWIQSSQHRQLLKYIRIREDKSVREEKPVLARISIIAPYWGRVFRLITVTNKFYV